LAADPSYRREVVLRLELEHRGWRVLLHGRADGVRRNELGQLVVEEIKSVRRGQQLSPLTLELYRRQASIYAWMLSKLEPAEQPQAELVLIEIGGDGADRHPIEPEMAAIEGAIRRQLNTLIRERDRSRRAAGERRDAADRIAFPFEQLRPGQEQVVEAVAQALEQGDHLLVEAPTGIGKTVAALWPTLLYALRHEKRVFVLTAKTLQQDLATRVLGWLNGAGDFRSLRLRAKSKMCANGEVICHEEYCPFAKDYYTKLASTQLLPRLLHAFPSLEPNDIWAAAAAAECCPFEVSLDLIEKVQVTVCDYNYVFDPYVALADFGAEGTLDDVILVIDEVHNLVERGRGYYSPALDAAVARAAGERMSLEGWPIHRRIGRVCESLAVLIEDAVAATLGGGAATALETRLPEDELWEIRPELDRVFVDYLEHQRETKSFRAEDPFVALYFDVLKFLNAMVLVDDTFATIAVREPGAGARLQILNKDPSRFLGKILDRVHSAIGLSATITPVDFYRDLLGFSAGRTFAISVGSPFPPENRAVVVDAAVETTWRERVAYMPLIAERLGEFAAAVPGNCLALFPSYQFLADVAERLHVPGRRILIQQRGDDDATRETLLDALRSSLFGDVLLLAVAGGVFAEGVDYPGEMLQAVAVVSPCLPAVTLEREILKTYYDERFERGFEFAYVVPGMTRVIQAAGRLLRTPADRGVIALLDRRFAAAPYRNFLPSWWLAERSVKQLVGSPSDVARGFFAAR
jgi:DNA excision repair protein ERCC-2